MAHFGIKVSKPNKSITSTDPRDYNLWSKYKVLKVAQSGGGSFTANAGNSGILTINHNLGYNPIVFFFKEKTAGAGGTDSGKSATWSNYDVNIAYAAIENDSGDLNNITVQFTFPGAGDFEYSYYYYLMYDESINT